MVVVQLLKLSTNLAVSRFQQETKKYFSLFCSSTTTLQGDEMAEAVPLERLADLIS